MQRYDFAKGRCLTLSDSRKEILKISINSFISLAQRNGIKETSTPSKASPYMGRMQHRKPQKPTVFFRFGKPGHGLIYLSAGALRKRLLMAGAEKKTSRNLMAVAEKKTSRNIMAVAEKKTSRNLMAVAEKKTSRVPRYQKVQEVDGFCDFLVKSLTMWGEI